MPRKTDFSNTHKYDNRKSFNDQPVEAGKVLVPFRKDQMELRSCDYIADNFTTMTLGEFKFELGFMSIDEACFADYMRDFWKDINKELLTRHEGRCILGQNPAGTDIICSNAKNRCIGCLKKGMYERSNPNRVDILSLNYEYENKEFDIEDTSQPSVEDQVINKLCPEPTQDEIQIRMLTHFDKTNPRYAQIIRLSLQDKEIDEICISIGLKPSRGRQEINSAHDAVCDYLRLRHHKKSRK